MDVKDQKPTIPTSVKFLQSMLAGVKSTSLIKAGLEVYGKEIRQTRK